jgi:hypothetical protein
MISNAVDRSRDTHDKQINENGNVACLGQRDFETVIRNRVAILFPFIFLYKLQVYVSQLR